MAKDYSYLVEILITKMFELAGHQVSYKELMQREDDWYNQYTITEDQQEEWIKFGVDIIRKEMKIPKYKAEREMGMVLVNWGLKCEK